MKVTILGYNHSVNDKRVLRTVRAISKECEVVYIYRRYPHLLDEERKLEKELINVKFVPIEKKGRGGLSRLLFDKENVSAVLDNDTDIWYFHRVPYLFPLLLFKEGRKRGKRIIYDTHEFFPWHSFANFTRGKPMLDLLRRNWLWGIYRYQIFNSDVVIQVSYSIAMHTEKVLGKFPGIHVVVPNLAMKVDLNEDAWFKKDDRIVYVGGVDRALYVDYIRKLVSELDVSFEYISKSPSQILEKMIPDRVTWYNPMPYEDMMRWLSTAKWSLLTFSHFNNLTYVYSLPNKFFDSLYAGVPVIVHKDFIEMSAWVKKYGVGVVVDDSLDDVLNANYEEIMDALIKNRHKFVWNDYWDNYLLKLVKGEQVKGEVGR